MNLKQTITPKGTRFYIDSVRVSRDTYYDTITEQEMKGKRLNCFYTKTKQLPGGSCNYTNYSRLS